MGGGPLALGMGPVGLLLAREHSRDEGPDDGVVVERIDGEDTATVVGDDLAA